MIARSNAHDFRPFCLDLHHRDLAFAGSCFCWFICSVDDVDPLIFANVLAQRSRWAIEIIDGFSMIPINCRTNEHCSTVAPERKRERNRRAVFFQFRPLDPVHTPGPADPPPGPPVNDARASCETPGVPGYPLIGYSRTLQLGCFL